MAVIRIPRETLAQLVDLPDGAEIRNADMDVRTLDILLTISGPTVPERGSWRPTYADYGFSGLSMDPASHKALTGG